MPGRSHGEYVWSDCKISTTVGFYDPLEAVRRMHVTSQKVPALARIRIGKIGCGTGGGGGYESLAVSRGQEMPAVSGAAAELARRRKARRAGEEDDGDHGGGAGSRGVESARVGALSPLSSFKLVKSQTGCLTITLRYSSTKRATKIKASGTNSISSHTSTLRLVVRCC
eukprot:SAG11_NODE_3169_length_2637_cov_10.122537_1_plen_169_part_00